MWQGLLTSNDMSFNLLLISLPKLRIKAPASQSLYNTTSVDCRQHKSHTILKNRKLSTSGGNGGVGKVNAFTSAWLCPVDRLPSGLHAHGARATISALGPSFPHCVPLSPSPVFRVKLAVICRPSTMVVFNCERRHQLIQCPKL